MPNKLDRVRVRRAASEEISTVDTLFRDEIYSQFDVASNYVPQRSAKSMALVATRGEEIVAAIQLGELNDGDFRLDHLAVKDKDRKKKIGQLLLREAEDQAWIEGASVMTVDALPDSSGFFEKHGYHKTGKISVGSVADSQLFTVEMQKSLTAGEQEV